jgi:aryl-alcohol dehydrogenase-like predicted oxidoreductase
VPERVLQAHLDPTRGGHTVADLPDTPLSRRKFLKGAALVSASLSLGPHFVFGKTWPDRLMKRPMGRLGFEATTLGLGGQSSLQWTPADEDPVRIILKAFDLGINYYDTSNVYGPSQSNYGKAFRELHLVPGRPGYNERLRRSFFLTTKTMLRFGKGGWKKEGLWNWTDGAQGSTTVDDIRRTLSLVFGDGQGAYPKGAYVDMVLVHALESPADIEAVYEGYGHPDPKAEHIGALATLIDFRDGTNLTGLNPKEERLLRHIGFSAHASPATTMEMIQRDHRGVLDGLLVAINANDRMNFSMQLNAIPVAAANNIGVIAMKVFADGAMYSKPATWTSRADMLVRTVGSPALPSRRLVEYSLTTPGVHTAVIGIGHIDSDSAACQLEQNLLAAQVEPAALGAGDRRAIEELAHSAKEGKTNYFQAAAQPLGSPRSPAASQRMRGERRTARLEWHTAYAGDEPLVRYEIWRDGRKTAETPHKPQARLNTPFAFEETLADRSAHRYRVVAVDRAGRRAGTEELDLPNI